MPIIKSAKKRVKQTKVRQLRNYNVRTAMKKAIRNVQDAVKAGNKAEAEKLLMAAYKVIDTSDKKNILSSNTAARRKASLAHLVASTGEKKLVEKEEKPKKVEKKAKKVEKVEKVEEPAEEDVVSEDVEAAKAE